MQSIFDLVEEAIEAMADAVKEAAPVIAGGGVPITAMALADDVNVSFMDMTTRLATLGMGSVLGGVLAVGLMGVGSYYGVKKLIELFPGA